MKSMGIVLLLSIFLISSFSSAYAWAPSTDDKATDDECDENPDCHRPGTWDWFVYKLRLSIYGIFATSVDVDDCTVTDAGYFKMNSNTQHEFDDGDAVYYLMILRGNADYTYSNTYATDFTIGCSSVVEYCDVWWNEYDCEDDFDDLDCDDECTNWDIGSCGSGSCDDDERKLTRDCDDDRCSESRCQPYSGCDTPSPQCTSTGGSWVSSPSECCDVACSDKRCVDDADDCGTCASSPGMPCTSQVPCCDNSYNLECVSGTCQVLQECTSDSQCTNGVCENHECLDYFSCYQLSNNKCSSTTITRPDYYSSCSDAGMYSTLYSCESHIEDDPVDKCTDTDGGIKLTIKGTVKSDGKTYTDFCGSDGRLQEYYCSNNLMAAVTSNCANDLGANYICEDGICVGTGAPEDCASIPDIPCDNAIWQPYPTCKWDEAKCEDEPIHTPCDEPTELISSFCQDNDIYQTWNIDCEEVTDFVVSCGTEICTDGICLSDCDSSTCSWGAWSECTADVKSRIYTCTDTTCDASPAEFRTCDIEDPTVDECTNDEVWVCSYVTTEQNGLSIKNPCLASEEGYDKPCSTTDTTQCYKVGKCNEDGGSDIDNNALLIIGGIVVIGLAIFALKK